MACMTIAELEQQIKDNGSLMATALMQYELSGCVVDRGDADAYEQHMKALIAQRVAAEKERAA